MSSSEAALDLLGVLGRSNALRWAAERSPPTIGEGRGVRSDIAARKGEVMFEPGDDAMLEEDKVDRNEEPRVGNLVVGEVIE